MHLKTKPVTVSVSESVFVTYDKTLETQFIFGTLTYDRKKITMADSWKGVSKHYNQYIHKVVSRTKPQKYQYLRSIEAHKKDPYPHIHFVLILKNPIKHNCYPKKKNPKKLSDYYRYIESGFYKHLDKSWKHGLVNFQVPHSKRRPLAYILKYATKEASVKNLYKMAFKEKEDIDTAELENSSLPELNQLQVNEFLETCGYELRELSEFELPLLSTLTKFMNQDKKSRQFFHDLKLQIDGQDTLDSGSISDYTDYFLETYASYLNMEIDFSDVEFEDMEAFNHKVIDVDKSAELSKKYKVKQVHWSRNFQKILLVKPDFPIKFKPDKQSSL